MRTTRVACKHSENRTVDEGDTVVCMDRPSFVCSLLFPDDGDGARHPPKGGMGEKERGLFCTESVREWRPSGHPDYTARGGEKALPTWLSRPRENWGTKRGGGEKRGSLSLLCRRLPRKARRRDALSLFFLCVPKLLSLPPSSRGPFLPPFPPFSSPRGRRKMGWRRKRSLSPARSASLPSCGQAGRRGLIGEQKGRGERGEGGERVGKEAEKRWRDERTEEEEKSVKKGNSCDRCD